MDTQQQSAYESVIQEQADIIQQLEHRINGYKTMASIASQKGRAARERKMAKGKTHSFVKILRTANQRARRKGFFTSAEKQLLFDLQAFVDFKGLVVKEDKAPMALTDVADLCGWGKTHTINTVNSLVEKGVIEKLKQGTAVHLRLNQDFFKCG